jgi:outer membrane protein
MKKIIAPALLFIASFAIAQTAATPITLDSAIMKAFKFGPDLASSTASLENAKASLTSTLADPSSLITQITQAQNTVELQSVQLQAQRISVTGNVTTAFLNLFEAQENIAVLQSAVALDQTNLNIAKAKLAQKNGTQLDVSKAENTLASDTQSLTNANNNLPILSNKLEPLLGLPLNSNLKASEAPAFKEVKLDLASLQNGLEKRVASVLQASQGVEVADLNVQLSDNDYTAPATLRDFKTTLENSRRSLETSKANAVTTLKDAYRNVINSLELVKVASKNLDNANTSLAQDTVKFKSGTISKVQLQQTQNSNLQSQYSYLTNTNNYLKALNQLSSAAGTDVTGLVTVGLGGGAK